MGNIFRTILIGLMAFFITTDIVTRNLHKQISKEIKTVRIEGLNLSYRESGPVNGKPIVFLHGFGGSSYDWNFLMGELSKEYRCVALDIPPFGLSEKSENFDYSDRNLVKVIISFIKSLNINQFTLVGHSMGGYLSILTAINEPDRIEKLILLDSAFSFRQSDENINVNPNVPSDEENLDRLTLLLNIGLKTYPVVKFVYKNFVGETMDLKDIEHFDYIFSQNYFLPAEVLVKFSKDKITQENVELDLSNLNMPTLIMYGENDTITPPSIGKYLSEHIMNSKFILIPNEGHLPLWNEKVLMEIKKFLRNGK
ncbi:MAG: alpha/beta fold hydrolase [Fervidobacterium sp.]|uniref:alpha/beta fold hydrolase n=1 Tax=Fervidobacterium sp. TaxID=1871331 RepID=UPI00404A274F